MSDTRVTRSTELYNPDGSEFDEAFSVSFKVITCPICKRQWQYWERDPRPETCGPCSERADLLQWDGRREPWNGRNEYMLECRICQVAIRGQLDSIRDVERPTRDPGDAPRDAMALAFDVMCGDAELRKMIQHAEAREAWLRGQLSRILLRKGCRHVELHEPKKVYWTDGNEGKWAYRG